MVDVVNDEVRGGAGYITMHLDGFAVLFSDGVKGLSAELGEPLKLGQVVIIRRINDGKPAASDGNATGDRQTEFDVCSRIEIRAGVGEKKSPPSVLKTTSVSAGKNGTASADYPGRKNAVVATPFIFNFQMSIFYLFSSPTRSASFTKYSKFRNYKKSSPPTLCTNLRLSCENGEFLWLRKSITPGCKRR